MLMKSVVFWVITRRRAVITTRRRVITQKTTDFKGIMYYVLLNYAQLFLLNVILHACLIKFISCMEVLVRSRYSSVGIVPCLKTGNRGIVFKFPTVARDVSFLRMSAPALGTTQHFI